MQSGEGRGGGMTGATGNLIMKAGWMTWGNLRLKADGMTRGHGEPKADGRRGVMGPRGTKY